MIETSRDPLLTPEQTAEKLTVRTDTLAVWRCTGRYKLPFLKVGRNVRYRLSDVNAWLEARLHETGVTGGAA